MPIYEVECDSCGKKKELITLSCDEILPLCSCGGEYYKLPSTFTFRWLVDEGVWEETPDGRQEFKGKGGKKHIYGGEKLDVHGGLPENEGEKPYDPRTKDGMVEGEKHNDFLKEIPDAERL